MFSYSYISLVVTLLTDFFMLFNIYKLIFIKVLITTLNKDWKFYEDFKASLPEVRMDTIPRIEHVTSCSITIYEQSSKKEVPKLVVESSNPGYSCVLVTKKFDPSKLR